MKKQQRELMLFIKQLKAQRDTLNRQQLLTLRGQALAGDLVGARVGLENLLKYSGAARRSGTHA